MKRFSLVLILLLSMPSFSSAEWVMLPLEELVCDSDLIVVGTLPHQRVSKKRHGLRAGDDHR